MLRRLPNATSWQNELTQQFRLCQCESYVNSFMLLVSLYTLWKHQRYKYGKYSFLMLSGVIEKTSGTELVDIRKWEPYFPYLRYKKRVCYLCCKFLHLMIGNTWNYLFNKVIRVSFEWLFCQVLFSFNNFLFFIHIFGNVGIPVTMFLFYLLKAWYF